MAWEVTQSAANNSLAFQVTLGTGRVTELATALGNSSDLSAQKRAVSPCPALTAAPVMPVTHEVRLSPFLSETLCFVGARTESLTPQI